MRATDKTYPLIFPQLGMTLIELLTTLSVIAITMSIGFPSMSKWIKTKSQNAAFETLYHSVTFARTKAIRQQENFTICASKDNTQCNGEWNDTIIIFNDHNKNAQLDSSEILYKTISMPQGTPCIQWRAGGGRDYLRFKANGATSGTAGHFRYCDPNTTQYDKKLVVSFTGRTSIKKL